MKRLVRLSIVGGLISCFLVPYVAVAGNIPEELISDDRAKLYIGEVIEYDKKEKVVTIQPILKIKGEIILNEAETLRIADSTSDDNGKSNEYRIHNGKTLKQFEQCLVIEYNDFYNSIFQLSGDHLGTLKIKDLNKEDMWKRVETYINDGTYEEAEAVRLEKLGVTETVSSRSLPPAKKATENYLYWLGLCVVFPVLVLLLIWLKRRQRSIG